MILEAYRNLRKNCYSLRYKGIVYAYRDEFILTNAIFKVNQKAREKVLKLKVKNVHAVVKGEFQEYKEISLSNSILVSYNPYKFGYFYRKDNFKPIINANIVLFNKNEVRVWI